MAGLGFATGGLNARIETLQRTNAATRKLTPTPTQQTKPQRGRLTPLDPWTVYGEAADTTGRLDAVDVPDIGVLPPAGRYRGTVRSRSGVAPATHVVPAPTDVSRHPRYRRITIESCVLPNENAGTSVAITFEQIVGR